MVSHDASVEMVDKCKDLGCFDYLTKPLKINRLHDSIQRCFFANKGTSRKYSGCPSIIRLCSLIMATDYSLYTETLSEGGMYVIKEEPLPAGSEVVVRCDLGERGEIRAKGNVIYTKKLFGDFF